MDDERGPKIEKVAVRHGRLERRNGDVDYSLHPQQQDHRDKESRDHHKSEDARKPHAHIMSAIMASVHSAASRLRSSSSVSDRKIAYAVAGSRHPLTMP
ncbi:hypothetical protein EV291_115127 [Rhizobium sp. BK068]|nr:hypothetical protein EV291_115127 [Rhizobium sp. BK068]